MSQDDIFSDLDNDSLGGAVSGGNLFDLSDVKASATSNPPALPKGIYPVAVDSVSWGASQRSGSLMLTWKFKVIGGEHASRTIMDWTILIDKDKKRDPRGMAKLKAYLQMLVPDIDMSSFDPERFANSKMAEGKVCMLKIAIQGKGDEARNNVADILPFENPDAIDDSSGVMMGSSNNQASAAPKADDDSLPDIF